MEEKIKAIYYLKDLRTDKIIYIGQTKDFKERKRAHFRAKKCPIDKHMFEEGRENFSMNIFKDIDYLNITYEELKTKENELIKCYDTINNGWNKNRSGLISNNTKEYQREYSKTEKYKDHCKEKRNNEQYKEYQREYQREYSKTEKYKEYKKQYRLKKKLEKLANETS